MLALDAPGLGPSDAATSDNYDHPAAVLEFMDALGIEKAALVGNSMGGMTAITFAARYPDRIPTSSRWARAASSPCPRCSVPATVRARA